MRNKAAAGSLSEIDFLILQLVYLDDRKFVEEVLKTHEFKTSDFSNSDQLPSNMERSIAKIFEERLVEIGQEELEA